MDTKDIKEMIEQGVITRHHTSLFRGYISRKSPCIVESYAGKFGTGYVVREPNLKSTRYSYVTYYVSK